MTRKSLAVIGGGASAVFFLAHLARQSSASLFDIDVYDRRGRFGQGVAYSTEHISHRLNVRAANMSLYADQPEDFAAWVKPQSYTPEDFVPRLEYARYLAERLEPAMKKLNLRFVQEDVVFCHTDAAGYKIKTAQGAKTYDAVVATTGNVRLIEPQRRGDIKNYVAEPWQLAGFERLPKDGRIVLLGTGLSAADAIASLQAQAFTGEILAISRKGWFPQIHVAPEKYAAFLGGEELSLSPAALMKRIRQEVRAAVKLGVSWQAVIDSLRPNTNSFWQKWSPAQRATFLRHGLTAWNVHRHRMPGETAAMIDGYVSRGQLKIVKDRVLYLEAPGRVVCSSQAIKADGIVNCLGYRYDEGRNLEADYCIGPAAFGDLFETTAIPEIRSQAAEIAAAIASALFK